MNFLSDGKYFIGHSIVKENMSAYFVKIKDQKVVISDEVLDSIYDRCAEWIIYSNEWSFDQSKKNG